MSVWSWSFGILIVVIVPWISARGLRAAATEGLPRTALYANICVSLWVLAALGFLVVKLDGQTLADVLVTWRPFAGSPSLFIAWTLVPAAGGLALFAASRLARARHGPSDDDAELQRLRPRRPSERAWILAAVSPSAGLCEEFLYRGFLLSRTAAILGSPLTAAALSSVAFGLAHLYQGRLGAARAGAIALLLAVPVLATGSLLPSMAAHALIDAVGILWLWPLLDRKRGAPS